MSLRYCLGTLVLLSVAGTAASRAHGQAGRQPATAAYQPTSAYQQSTGRNNAALNFYGRPKSLQHTQQSRAMPLPPPAQPTNGRAPAKPFSGVQQTSSISPYLALDNIETSTSLPNYFLFVKPQLDFQARLRAQNAQNWRQQQQMNAAAARSASGNTAGETATTGDSTQFMNNGGYYPGLR